VREPAPSALPSLSLSVDRAALAAACRRHHIRWLAVFGSRVTGTARPDSDVDVVVDFEPGMTPGFGIGSVAAALQPVLGGARVDLVTRRGLRPPLREHILSGAVVLHGA
jgi:predicted nucleotidyltransferase